MKQIIFTFEVEQDYNEFIEALIIPLSPQVGKVDENADVIHVTIGNLKGDTK